MNWKRNGLNLPPPPSASLHVAMTIINIILSILRLLSRAVFRVLDNWRVTTFLASYLNVKGVVKKTHLHKPVFDVRGSHLTCYRSRFSFGLMEGKTNHKTDPYDSMIQMIESGRKY